jgi:uncharacterized membrane protein
VTPERFRVVVSTVLIIGVTLSAILITAGFAGSLVVGWEGSLVGAGDGAHATTDFGALGGNLLALRPIGLAQVGLIVLIATPVVRVASSVVGFALEGDRLYAGITLIVLAVLLSSLFILR